MAIKELLTPTQRKQIYEIPEEMEDRELARYYRLSDEELKVVYQQRGAANRLGFGVQIGYLRFPGRPLAANEKVPEFIVKYIAGQIKVSPSAMQNYARERDTTRREHLVKIRNTFGFRNFTSKEYRELAQWSADCYGDRQRDYFG